MTVFIAILCALALAAGLGVVIPRSPVRSALSLVLCIGLLAVIFLTLNAQFLFAVQLIIYAGAVVVLFIFIIALLSPSSEDRPILDWRMVVGLVATVAITAAFVFMAHNGITYDANGTFHGAVAGGGGTASGGDPYNSFAYTPCAVNNAGGPNCSNPLGGNTQTVAGQLFTTFLLPFEITSLLLLVSAIGAVYLTRRISVRRTTAQ